MFDFIFKMFLIFLFPPLIIILIFLISLFYQYFILIKVKKMKRKKIQIEREKKVGFFKKIFYVFPKQLALDIVKKDPEDFNEWGVHLICGEQGSGKTITTCYLLQEWKRKYPLAKITTNMTYKYEDRPLLHWKDLLNYQNGKYGTIKVLDEIQTWFNSNQSKDFPVEMLGEVSQQRKQRSAIIGTTQVFNRVAKPLREQTHFVYLPITIFGCLTIVLKSKSKWWNDEKQKFTRYCGGFFFIQNKKIRESFDTFEKIEKYKETGFHLNNQLSSRDNSS